MVPSPYGVRWTSRLIYRDLRGIATEFANKARSLFLRTADAAVAVSQDHVEYEPPIDTESRHAVAPLSSEHSTTFTTADSYAIAATDATERSLEESITLYDLLNTKLKELYASRERDLPLNERWIFRGAWLILNMATQCCASNPSYDILNAGSSSTDESALLLAVLRESPSDHIWLLLTSSKEHSMSIQIELPTSRVSQMPAMPYTKCNDDYNRHDSVFSTLSITKPSPTSPAHLWYIILSGASDRMKTVQAAEFLLNHAWPEKDADAVLKIVGNPAERLSDSDETELRRALGRILYPRLQCAC